MGGGTSHVLEVEEKDSLVSSVVSSEHSNSIVRLRSRGENLESDSESKNISSTYHDALFTSESSETLLLRNRDGKPNDRSLSFSAKKYLPSEEEASPTRAGMRDLDTGLVNLEKLRVAEVKLNDTNDDLNSVLDTQSQRQNQPRPNINGSVAGRPVPKPFVPSNPPAPNAINLQSSVLKPQINTPNKQIGTISQMPSNRSQRGPPIRPTGLPPNQPLPNISNSTLLGPNNTYISPITNPAVILPNITSYSKVPVTGLPSGQVVPQMNVPNSLTLNQNQQIRNNNNVNNSDNPAPSSLIFIGKEWKGSVVQDRENITKSSNLKSMPIETSHDETIPKSSRLRAVIDRTRKESKELAINAELDSDASRVNMSKKRDGDGGGGGDDDDDDDEEEEEDVERDEHVYDWTAFDTTQGEDIIANSEGVLDDNCRHESKSNSNTSDNSNNPERAAASPVKKKEAVFLDTNRGASNKILTNEAKEESQDDDDDDDDEYFMWDATVVEESKRPYIVPPLLLPVVHSGFTPVFQPQMNGLGGQQPKFPMNGGPRPPMIAVNIGNGTTVLPPGLLPPSGGGSIPRPMAGRGPPSFSGRGVPGRGRGPGPPPQNYGSPVPYRQQLSGTSPSHGGRGPPIRPAPLAISTSTSSLGSNSLVNADDESGRPVIVKETADVKRNRAQLPSKTTHAPPKTGDWVTNRYIVNNYILLDILGSGSYGEVRMAKDRVTDKIFALKILSKDFLKKRKNGHSNETYFEDIRREIAIMKKLNHPNVLRLFEVLDDPKVNKIYLVLEYMKKGDLVHFLKEREKQESQKLNTSPPQTNPNQMIPTVPDDELWYIFLYVCRGVTYLHRQNVIHGDIKPQNILVGEDGLVKIADFGISRMLSGSTEKIADAAGTPAFMSPELCDLRSGVEISGQLADVWALGATIFMLKFGHPPFVAGNQIHLFAKIQGDPLVFPNPINTALQNLLENMLVKDPLKRFTLDQVSQHEWFNRPPVSATAAHHPSLQLQSNLTSSPHPSHTHSLNVNGNTIHTLQRTLFHPPPTYDEEQAKAMAHPVHKADNDEIFMSIGLGTRSRADLLNDIRAHSTGHSSTLQGEAIAEESTGNDSNIMSTNWGNDVFEPVHEDIGSGSDDDDDYRDTTNPVIKNVPKSGTSGSSGSGGSGRSSVDTDSNRASGGQVQRELMAKKEEEERAKRFREKVRRKSRDSVASTSNNNLLIAREVATATANINSDTNISSVSNSNPVNKLAKPSNIKTNSQNIMSRENSGTSRKPSPHASGIPLAKRRGSQDLKILTKFGDSQKFTVEPKSTKPSPSPRRQASDDIGRDESFCDDIEDTKALDMDDFVTLMDTLANRPTNATSIMTRSGSMLSTAHSFSNVNAISAVLSACNHLREEEKNSSNQIAGTHHSIQGNRTKQEDRIIFISDLSAILDQLPDHLRTIESLSMLRHISIGCIFDGHSGELCSDYLSKHFIPALLSKPDLLHKPWGDTLKALFIEIDEKVCQILRKENDESGSTGTVMVIDGRSQELTLAHIGDSSCIVSQEGRAIQLLRMHRALDPDEKIKIELNGGKVINNRVNGVLAVSRAFGDVQFKSYKGSPSILSCTPDIFVEKIDNSLEFLVIASDGLWDAMNPQVVVNFVRKKSSSRGDLALVARDLVHEAVAQGSVDNVSAMIIVLHFSGKYIASSPDTK